MLGIGMQEILIILAVALIVIGPKRLPELAKTLGKGFAEFRKAADDLQETVRLDLQKEKHEDFREKYPDIVPDEDGAEPEPRAESAETTGDKIEDKPEPEPEPSYNPEEIEGGDETEDDTRDA